MLKLRNFIAVAMLGAIAACSTTPPPPSAVIAPPKFVPPPTNYEWTNGFSAKGFEAMHRAIGKVRLAPGEHYWIGTPPAEGDVAITVDIANQIAFVFKGEQLIGVTNVSTGKKGHPTPLGFWKVNFKREKYFSRKYDNAPMPYMLNIDDKGIAFHGGKTPGYPASHGCIRLPHAFAKALYPLAKVGNKVVIEG